MTQLPTTERRDALIRELSRRRRISRSARAGAGIAVAAVVFLVVAIGFSRGIGDEGAVPAAPTTTAGALALLKAAPSATPEFEADIILELGSADVTQAALAQVAAQLDTVGGARRPGQQLTGRDSISLSSVDPVTTQPETTHLIIRRPDKTRTTLRTDSSVQIRNGPRSVTLDVREKKAVEDLGISYHGYIEAAVADATTLHDDFDLQLVGRGTEDQRETLELRGHRRPVRAEESERADAVRSSALYADEVELEVDVATGLPLRVDFRFDGNSLEAYSLRNLNLNPAITAATFDTSVPGDFEVIPITDLDGRTLSLAEAAATVPFTIWTRPNYDGPVTVQRSLDGDWLVSDSDDATSDNEFLLFLSATSEAEPLRGQSQSIAGFDVHLREQAGETTAEADQDGTRIAVLTEDPDAALAAFQSLTRVRP